MANDATAQLQAKLRSRPPRDLEKLAAELLGHLLGVTFTLARGGSQHGGDGGVHGDDGRHLVYEARRYGGRTPLREREIRGEISEAVERDPDLELWVLVATRNVPEQTVAAMESAARQQGIDAVTIDWMPARLPRLAALCASAPSACEAVLGKGFEALLSEIASSPYYAGVLASIRASLQTAGYEMLRSASHRRVVDVWTDPDKALMLFNQNVSGGHASASHIRRSASFGELDAWHAAIETENQPLLVTGREGTGKTWAVLDWLYSRLDQLPIVVLAPSSSIPTLLPNRSALIDFVALCLRDLDSDSARNPEFWKSRARQLLRRTTDKGSVLTLFFDGLNEKPSEDWPRLLNLVQDEQFHSRVRVIASARSSFVDERMRHPNAFVRQPTRIEVIPYDDEPGGEFECKLDATGLSRQDLPASLAELARVPRLFDMVIALKDRLGGVASVTIHRLFWEHGAASFQTTGFTAVGWPEFLLELAKMFREKVGARPRRQVENLTAEPAAKPDEVYRRTSTVIDGVFAQLSKFGEVEFEPEFVRHALGLSLVHRLHDKSAAESREELETFFQPANNHDEEAEIVRAAVSIALAMQLAEYDAPLGALCSWWVQCQNLPNDHLEELAGLAPELVEPLLDAIERSEGHAASSPRYRAVNVLRCVDNTDRATARAIATRGTRWLERISAESWLRPGPKRLESRIGTSDEGRRTVLGREVEVVSDGDEDPAVAAAQLLQDRPLVEAIDFLEAGALHLAITGGSHEEQSWLNLTNGVDPTETAKLLRLRSDDMARCNPEPGVHRDLGRRVAAILLRRTGYEEDAVRALAVEPGLDRRPSYAKDYVADPTTSTFYPLERRHAEGALRRRDVSLRSRIERSAAFLVDPSLSIPETFAAEAVAAANALDRDAMSTGRSRTIEDLTWRHLTLVLARCAPEELAHIERQRLRGFARREGEGRYGAALTAPDAMLLVGDAERAALQELRERTPDDKDGDEWLVQSNLLLVETQGETADDQLRRVLAADPDGIDASLAFACAPPSPGMQDDLVERNLSEPKETARIAGALGEKRVSLGDKTIQAFLDLLFAGHDEVEVEPVWVVLGINAPQRLGVILDGRNWSWSAEKPYIENVMGSVALAVANRHTPFEELAFRIAPMKLLAALSDREECTPQDIHLAVDLIDKVLLASSSPPTTNPLEVLHDRTTAEQTFNYLHSYGDVREADDEVADVRLLLRIGEDYQKRRRELAEAYYEEVMAARRCGAHFRLEFVVPEHFDVVLHHRPQAIDSWLDGLENRSPEFVARVGSADGFFMSLCEALLARTPSRGVALWRALRECLTVRFVVHGDMDRLLHALFAAGDDPEVQQALTDAYAVQSARSDRHLVDLVVAARRFGRVDWLREEVARDAGSSSPLRQRRAAFLEPLLDVPEIASAGDWPVGEHADGVRGASWKLGQREAFARHWFQTFAQAETATEAHAAWRLFLACVDRRAWSWIADVLDQHSGMNSTLETGKRRFVRAQKHQIQRAMADNSKRWAENYTHRRFPKALQPWNG